WDVAHSRADTASPLMLILLGPTIRSKGWRHVSQAHRFGSSAVVPGGTCRRLQWSGDSGAGAWLQGPPIQPRETAKHVRHTTPPSEVGARAGNAASNAAPTRRVPGSVPADEITARGARTPHGCSRRRTRAGQGRSAISPIAAR